MILRIVLNEKKGEEVYMKIIFWTSTGNTESMAELISRGIEQGGKQSELINISDNSSPEIKDEKLVVLGCPAMGDEELDTSEFEPFLDENKELFNGRKVALFGSYGWGDGQWIRTWEDKMREYGAVIAIDSLIVNNAPEGDTADECIEFGKKLAAI